MQDFHPGGDLATQLARWGRLGRDRARFYAAEIVEGVEGLHAAGVIYRDLKPENILIGADGHIVLTDFGLSKEFSRATTGTGNGFKSEFYASVPGTPQPWARSERGVGEGGSGAAGAGRMHGVRDSTSTFCVTAEYLAPEVIQGMPYSYEVDWWSFGMMLCEMLTRIVSFFFSSWFDADGC
jgi:serum/glucocorticoid-regulated kinase 2